MKIHIKHWLSIVAVGTLFTACSHSVDASRSHTVAGMWYGACKNDTYGGTGTLYVSLKEDGGHLQGNLLLGGGVLEGSGAIEGTVQKQVISFTTPGNNRTFTHIRWQGRLKGDNISGTYRVAQTISAQANNAPVQCGRFTLSRTK